MTIYEQLKNLEQSNIYPFHMPGHKRVQIHNGFPYGIDITEINGFDDLHEPEGILLRAQQQAAELYDAKEAYYLVNGSTCGILAAISAAVPMGGKVLVARNCHKAVYHAIQLRNASAVYLYPEVDENGIAGPIRLKQIEDVLMSQLENGDENGCAKIDACILTSPTYEGVVSDIEEIARLLHKYEIPLIVDEAHGAHFGFDPIFPENATRQGADIVIISIHKTLPAPTQTALLLSCSNRIERAKIKLYLDIYETSSPSYVLMSAMEQALHYAKSRKDKWEEYATALKSFYVETKSLKRVKVMTTDDPSKIVILEKRIGGYLRKEYEIEVEMESRNYAVLMTSMMDTKEGYERLVQALLQLDQREELAIGVQIETNLFQNDYFASYEKAKHTICEAIEAEKEEKKLYSSAGRVAGEYVYLYPPGIPVVVPGETITDEVLTYLRKCEEAGLRIKGPANLEKIMVLK